MVPSCLMQSPSLCSQFLSPLPPSKLPSASHWRTTCSTSNPPPDLVRLLGQTLWGQGLPPAALVGAVRFAWNSGWSIMMKQLAPSDNRGAYHRPISKFRTRLPHPVAESELGRYHLYVSLTCPWAHRTVIVHALKGLHEAVPLSVTVPSSTGSWEFRPETRELMDPEAVLLPTIDKANGCQRLMDVYKLRKGGYDGRATVPMLWDSIQKEIVSNESADIIEILNSDFNNLARNPQVDLAPQHLRMEIDQWNMMIYPKINNGVYRCGFAQGQGAYEAAVKDVFSALDVLEKHLVSSRYLCGDFPTLADVRLFTTLYRFDPVYHILFKCSNRKIFEYPNLYGYLQDMYQIPGVAATCDLPTIIDGYYKVLFPLNPGGISPIVPAGSESASLLSPHNREALSSSIKLPATL